MCKVYTIILNWLQYHTNILQSFNSNGHREVHCQALFLLSNWLHTREHVHFLNITHHAYLPSPNHLLTVAAHRRSPCPA